MYLQLNSLPNLQNFIKLAITGHWPQMGMFLALPTNFRLGWKGLPRTSTITTFLKSFITLGRGGVDQGILTKREE
jgi:hypothetical protein